MKTFQDQLGEIDGGTTLGSRNSYEGLPKEARRVLVKVDSALDELEQTLYRIDQRLDAGEELHLSR